MRNTQQVKIAMDRHNRRILIVEDVQETRDAIEELLKHDGYRVDSARDEDQAADRATRNPPDLILMSLAGLPEYVLSTANRIRERSGLTHRTPVVIFSLANVPEGAEEALFGNIHLTAPDNFNQLRTLLTRILQAAYRTH